MTMSQEEERDSRELLDLRMGRKRPAHSGDSWSKEELQQLKDLFFEGVGISKLATMLGRTELAVVQKLKEMGAFEQQSRLRGPNRKPVLEVRCSCPDSVRVTISMV